jgi:hypothetical protein
MPHLGSGVFLLAHRLKKSANQNQELPVAAMFVNR